MRTLIATALALQSFCASAATADAYPTALVKEYDKQDSECRGQPGGSLRSDMGCASREVVYKRLNGLGWCYGSPDEPSYKKAWKPCTSIRIAKAALPIKSTDPNDTLSNETSKDFKTKDNGIACTFPGRLNEAYQAFQDQKWMKDIGCLTMKGGLKAVRVDDSYSVAHGEWKMRVFAEDGQSFTIYTHSCELAFPDGTPVRVCY